MQAIITQEEWEEYQKLKAQKAQMKPNALTGKVAYLHDLARLKITEYIQREIMVRFPYMRTQDQTELYNFCVDIAKFTFEESTGEKY